MSTRFETTLARATAAFEAGFTTKAAQKEALADVNRAYDEVKGAARAAMLAKGDAAFDVPAINELYKTDPEAAQALWTQRSQLIDELGYWQIPDYPHLIKDKHLPLFGDRVADAIACRDLRDAIKAAEILPIARDPADARIAAVRDSLIELMERRRAQYLEAVSVGEIFGGLPVTCNAHWVVNQYGTSFLRYYFYLRGKLTPLAVIMAAADELADRAGR